MNRRDAEALIAWLLDSAERVKYGSITVSVIRHDGQTRLVEKTCTEKTQVPQMGAADA
jgi:hypothetical protein